MLTNSIVGTGTDTVLDYEVALGDIIASNCEIVNS